MLWSIRSGKLFALIVLALAGWLLYQALNSPEYAVRRVTTRGTMALTAQDVEALADVTGRSIWFVRDDEVAARIRQSPYVERVSVQVLLPDAVEVQVTERRPQVRWTHGGVTYAVTWDGLVLSAAGATADPALAQSAPLSETAALSETATTEAPGPAFVSSVAIVDTTPNRELKPGDKVDPDALEIARRVTLRAAELPVPLQRVEWDAGLGVSLIVGDNKQAVIGKSERLDEKLAILNHVLRDNTPFTYLDLRSTTPSYR
jgi:cell division protein FtsQ